MKQVILGANGVVGRALAQELVKYSTDITLVSRNPKKVNPNDKLMAVDLTQKENVETAIAGADVVYVTIGFPYKTAVWKKYWFAFMENVAHACMAHGAKLVFFDNVYAIGGNGVNHITENSEINPTSKKGEVRAAIAKMILKHMESGKLKAIIARAPDFFGEGAQEKSFLIAIVHNRLAQGKAAQWFCNIHKKHSMGYVPDLARGTAILGNTEDAYNQIWNLPTDPKPLTGKEWVELFAKELNCKPKVTALPNVLFKTVGWVVPFFAELSEMNYQYDREYFFDSSKFNHRFHYRPTTNRDAVREVVEQIRNT